MQDVGNSSRSGLVREGAKGVEHGGVGDLCVIEYLYT